MNCYIHITNGIITIVISMITLIDLLNLLIIWINKISNDGFVFFLQWSLFSGIAWESWIIFNSFYDLVFIDLTNPKKYELTLYYRIVTTSLIEVSVAVHNSSVHGSSNVLLVHCTCWWSSQQWESGFPMSSIGALRSLITWKTTCLDFDSIDSSWKYAV